MTSRKILFLFILSLLSACADPKREEKLNEREQDLNKREEEFAAKAADYRSLLLMRDSLHSKKDSVLLRSWPEAVAGTWNGKTLCQASNCSDYVVGDQRTDTWEFTGDSTGIFTKILNRDELVRIFNVSAESPEVRLQFKTDSTASRKVEMNVILKPVTDNLIRGTQTININDNCTATFAVELVRASNK